MKKATLAFLLAVLSVSQALAVSRFVFKGTIGKYPIVIILLATEEKAYGNYYYVSQGKDKTLNLAGVPDIENAEPDTWYFTERVEGSYNGTFILKWDRETYQGDKTLVGTYTNVKEQSYTVSLTCVEMEEREDATTATEEPHPMSLEEFLWATKDYEEVINGLHDLSKALGNTIRPENARPKANQTEDPQRVMDFILLRYQRNDSMVQLRIAEVALEAADFFRAQEYDGSIEEVVISESIARYDKIAELSLKRARELRDGFTENWKEYSSKYGTEDYYIFNIDDAELAEYGIE